MPYTVTEELVSKFRQLEKDERQGIVVRTARVVLGTSVIRVFEKQTTEDLFAALKQIPVERLAKCQTQAKFDEFFFDALELVDKAILKKNRNRKSVGNGHKWGQGIKVLCLFLRDLVRYSSYFEPRTAKRIEQFLYVPIDSIVMKHLRACKIPLKPSAIKDIDSLGEFRAIQDVLTQAAEKANVARILFDEVWSENR
jgi:hypothetical protein